MRDIMLILHFIGLVMGLGTSFAHAFLGMAASKMSNDEATRFRMHAHVLSRMGYIGITLLIISGLYLITPYWPILTSTPLLILKLILVLLLVVLIILLSITAKKAKVGNTEAELKKMEIFGKMTFIVGLIILGLAVYVFH
ncbi:MAG: hypothetical protein KF741_11430 [Ferruginibacter sp.]|nr:hypothetical protein [Bacteroidota bacterium]MBX2919845.1 hypothetical protein [Ferruginibacter sp.]MCB0709556.1 hypothetical protein [Chitinophagaceae bacterium]